MSASTQLNTFTTNTKNILFLLGLITAVCSGLISTASYVGVRFVWPMLIEELRAELNVATKEDVERINDRIDDLSGEKRIFKMPEGHSYVLEPVAKGDPISLILVLRRTEFGLPCIFQGATPLFLDNRNIPFPGPTITPIKQVGLEQERLNIQMIAPSALASGRVGVTLSMHYTCPFGNGGQIIDRYEETTIIFFQLDPQHTVEK